MVLIVTTLTSCQHPKSQVVSTWNQQMAATYLDSREGWWTTWTGATRDHATFCVSCHTTLPYALARPRLRDVLGEPRFTLEETDLIDSIVKRVRLGGNALPYYANRDYGDKAAQSRGTESVLNSLILANYDATRGKLSDDTHTALNNMWSLQQTSGPERGSWSWLQFDQEPWEASDSAFYGATLAAVAVGIAPEQYAATPNIQGNLELLRGYLNKNAEAEPLINRVFLLWASTKLNNLLRPDQQEGIIREVLRTQRSDGGWALVSIVWKQNHWNVRPLISMWLRKDGTPQEKASDGLATGLITYALQEAGVPRDSAELRRGLQWLKSNQSTYGSWPASSMNKRRSQTSDTGRFMSDAATAFAVLALTDDNENTIRTTAALAH